MTEFMTSAEFPASPGSAAAARRFVEGTLQRQGWSPSDVDTVLLLTSEVVTNAVVHARTKVLLQVRLSPDTIRVEVDDHGTGEAVLAVADVDDVRGRGLRIVDALADRWGDDRACGRHCVWFELRAHA
jgi:anti-sigma regulatory factor (Ser/Thr protein kinase)